MLRDADNEVARTAWRAAVILVVKDEKEGLGEELVSQLDRGDRDIQLSLSRALIELGGVIEPALEITTASPDPSVAAHAHATKLLLQDPEIGFDRLFMRRIESWHSAKVSCQYRRSDFVVVKTTALLTADLPTRKVVNRQLDLATPPSQSCD